MRDRTTKFRLAVEVVEYIDVPPETDMDTTVQRNRRLNQTQILALASACLLVAAALLFVKPWQHDASPYGIVDQVAIDSSSEVDLVTGLKIGQAAPNFLLQTLDGDMVRLSDLRGRPVFLNFWATWCIFCVSEMPAMQQLSNRYGDQLVVAGINVGESRDQAATFAKQTDIRYLLLLDSDRDVTKAYTIFSMPTTYLIDEDGMIAFVRYGVLTPPEMDDIVRPLIAPADAGRTNVASGQGGI